MSTQILPLLTVDDLDALPDDDNRYELIEGDLLVSRAPHINHQLVMSNLLYAFRSYLERNPVGLIVPEAGVIFDQHNAVIPDLAFMTNERYAEIVSEGKMRAAPDLAIEVISAGQATRDRSLKRRLYGKFGVKEYWVVDPRARSVEVYLLTEQGLNLTIHIAGNDQPLLRLLTEQGLNLTATLREQDTLTSALLPNFTLQVAKVFEY